MGGRLLAWLLACSSTVGVATLSAPRDRPQGQPQGTAEVKTFTHKDHVGGVWFNLETKEVWRDCRGCHRFDADHTSSAPQQQCDSCHLPGNLGVQAKPGWGNDLAGYRTRTRDAFRHHTHGMLECRECHLPANVRFLVDFDIVTGPGQCARCHESGAAAAPDRDDDTKAPFALFRKWRLFDGALDRDQAKALGVPFFAPPRPEAYAAYAQRLEQVFAGPTGGLNTVPLPVGGDFDHHDHGDIACRDCHTNITTASAFEVGAGKIPSTGCARCHQADAKGTGARPASGVKTTARPLWSLGAFVHADHYRFLTAGGKRRDPAVATPAAYDALATSKTNGCEACHTQDPAAIGLKDRDFPFVPGHSKSRYGDCVVCHDVAGWKTGEDPGKALHDSFDGKVDDKNGWAECARCHVFGQGDFARSRPTTEVRRLAGRTFEFGVMTHPDITGQGIAGSGREALADCAKCHRARVPELASRIERRTFRHASHLPPAPGAKDCLACHPGAGTAATPGALADVELRTYSLADCKKCHLGSAVKEVADATPVAARNVVAFPHGPHAKAGASCVECHDVAKDGAGVGTKPAASACSMCHDHKAATKGPVAERLFDEQVRSCARCHHAAPSAGASEALAIPAIRGSGADRTDPRYNAEQTAFAGFADSQFHPLGTKCTECHKGVPIEAGTVSNMLGLKRKREDHVRATHKSPHAGQPQKQPVECLRCHWKPHDSGSFEAGITGSPADSAFRAKPASKETRKAFGNDSKGYPGTPQARG